MSYIRRELYHLYKYVLSKTKTARINGSRLISVLDSFSCEYCSQQRQSKMARVSKLRCHVVTCRRGNILKTFLMKRGESSLMTKTLICRKIIKKNNALFVCVFYVYSSEKTISSVTTQHFNNNCTPKKNTQKKQKNCQQPASSTQGKRKISHQKLTHAPYAFASQFSSYKCL